jgi:uncharacterized protein YcgI (DUF1989 family)
MTVLNVTSFVWLLTLLRHEETMRSAWQACVLADLEVVLKIEIVPKNSGAAFELRKGQRLRIAGKSIADFVAFNLHDLNERFDQGRTKTNQVKILSAPAMCCIQSVITRC